MNIITVLFGSALLLCKVHAQFCGPPILPPPLHTSIIGPPQLIPAPPTTPVVGTTIIDTSLSSALANVLQLLIVSDLIESTLNTALGHHSVPLTNPICEPVAPQPIVYAPTIDVITPVEYISPPCSPVLDLIPPRRPVDFVPQYGPVIDCLPPCAPVIDFTPTCPQVCDFGPKYGPVIDYLPPCGPFIDYTPPCFDFMPQYGPVIDYSPPCPPTIEFSPPCPPAFDFVPQYGPVIDYIPPCGPIFDFAPPCGPFIEPLPFYGDYTAPIPNLTPFPTSTPTNYCGGLTEYITNVAPAYTQTFPPNLCGCQEIIKPVQMAPLVPNCYNGLTEVLSPRVNVGPLATEIIFPSPAPSQLACNIGNIPATLPCVSLNVEPMPCGCGYGNNIIGTPYFY